MARRLDHDRIVARERGEQAVSADAESARLARADIRRDRRHRNPTVKEMFDEGACRWLTWPMRWRSHASPLSGQLDLLGRTG